MTAKRASVDSAEIERGSREDLLRPGVRHQKWAGDLAGVVARYADSLGVEIVSASLFFAVPQGHQAHVTQDCCHVETHGEWTKPGRGMRVNFCIQHCDKPRELVRHPERMDEWWSSDLGGP